MSSIKKIFNRFFLLIIFFFTFIYSKINLADEIHAPILERLPTSIFATVNGEPISIFHLKFHLMKNLKLIFFQN